MILAVAALAAVMLPDGRAFALRCSGSGRPTVVFESGWGADGRAWDGVRARLRDVRTCAYDRAGSGGSAPAPGRRGPAEIAADLWAGLRAAGERGPFLMVGHSAGGVYVRAFRAAHPRSVSGMVLVDSSALNQGSWMGLPTDAAAFSGVAVRSRACLDAALLERPVEDAALPGRCTVGGDPPRVWAARLAEISALAEPTPAERVADAAGFADMPVTTLTAGRGLASPARARWFALHASIAGRSTAGDARLVEESGHLMMRDAPDAIVEAVRAVAAKAAR